MNIRAWINNTQSLEDERTVYIMYLDELLGTVSSVV